MFEANRVYWWIGVLMPDRIVYADLIRVFTLLIEEAKTNGLGADGWALVKNPTWRVMQRAHTGYYAIEFMVFPEGGFIGGSMREAYESCVRLRQGMIMARRGREGVENG